jgi:hypothetical protein
MFKQWLLAGALAAGVIAAGCSGGGGSGGSSSGSAGGSGSSSGGSNNTTGPGGTAVTVSGPLSTVQSTLTGSVITPLEQATAGTPLQGVVTCANDVMIQNTLDVLNSLLNGLENPSSLSTTTPAQLQSVLTEMTNNLGSLLSAMANSGNCSGSTASLPTSNPLAGTQLAPLGAALLPVLQQIQTALASGAGSGGGSSGFAQLATLADELNAAFQSGMSQIPSSVLSQPVIGGLLTTLEKSINDLDAMMDAFASNSTTGFQTATQNLLTDLLDGLLTQVVPLTTIETDAGKPGAISGPIETAVATFSSAVAGALTQGETQLQTALSSSSFAPVMSVINQLLPAILGPITTALASVGSSGSSSSSSGGGTTGTPLDPVLAALTGALSKLLGGGSGTCVFASIPVLSVLCAL